MRDRFRGQLSYANVMATLAMFLTFGGGAYAASGGFVSGGGVINGCVPKHGGPLQVLPAGKRCAKGKLPLVFNQRGPQGPVGATGVAGPAGPAGANGTNGTNGAPGPTASAYSTLTSAVSLASSQNLVPVLTTTITTTFPARIVANGSFDVGRTSGAGNVRCVLDIAPSPFSSFTHITNEIGTWFDGTAVGQFEVTLPLTGAAVEPAGTYEIQAQCQTGSNGYVYYGDLTAVATAQ